MSDPDIDEFVEDYSEMLGRILACGNAEARAYALALLANSNDPDSVEKVEEKLRQIKLDLS